MMTWQDALAAVKAGKMKQSEAAREVGVKRQHFHDVYHGRKPIPKRKLGPRKPKLEKESPPMVEPVNTPAPAPAKPGPTWGGASPNTLDDVLRGPSDPNNPKPSLSPAPEPTRPEPPGASAPGSIPDDEPGAEAIDREAAEAGTDFLLMLRTGLLKTMLYYHGIDASDPRVQDLMPESDARAIRKHGSTLEFVLRRNPRFTQRVGKAAQGIPGLIAGVVGEAWRMKQVVSSLAAQMQEDPAPQDPPAPAPPAAPPVITDAPKNETPAFDLGAAIKRAAKPA